MTTIQRQLEEGLAHVDAALRNGLDSDVTTLANASQHIVTSGGKRIRPNILLLSYLAAGGDNLVGAAPIAAAIELVHTATLVHDDINDHSLMRRGRVSVHAKYGRTFALLAGDYMFAKVYEMMAPYGATINEIMSTACVHLVEGETLQALAAKSGDMSRETYKNVIKRKTGSLFDAAGRMGALYAEAEPEVVEALGRYGMYLGMAFQIVDDILDIVGDPEELGKPVGLDIAQGRGVMVAEARNGVAVKDDPVEQLRSKLRDTGALQIARLQAEEMADRARRALDNVPPSAARDALYGWIEAVLDRDK